MRRGNLIGAAILCLAVLAAYSGSFSGELTLDSKAHVLRDPRIRAVTSAGLRQIAAEDYWYPEVVSGLYRPVTTLSFLFNYAVLGNGERPAGYHWVNFLLHCLNIVLVYLLGLRIFRGIGPAFAAAALWGLHPASTEAVTNIAGRADLLAAACALAGLLCHIHGSETQGRPRVLWRILLGWIAALGMLSKESFAVLPGLMAAYDLTFREGPGWRARHMGYIVVLLPIIPFAVIRANVRAELPLSLVYPYVDNPLTGAGFWVSRLTAVKVIGKELWLLLWPRELSCDYSFQQIPLVRWPFQGWEDWQLPMAAAAFGAAGWLAVRRRRARFFVAFFFIALLPTSNLIVTIGSMMADRFVYLPSVGFAGCLVLGIFAACRTMPRAVAPVVVAVLCLALGCRTWARNRDWQTEYGVWSRAVETSPESFRTHRALASILMIEGKDAAAVDRAVTEMERCVAILNALPDWRNAAIAYAQAGLTYRRKGDLEAAAHGDAQPWYRKSLDTLVRAAAIDRATAEHAGQHGPAGIPELYTELAITYRRLGQPEQALEALRKGLRLDPYNGAVYAELAEAYAAAGDAGQAAVAWLEGMRMAPGQADFGARLEAVYRQLDPGCAPLVREGELFRLNKGCELLRKQVCVSRKNLALLLAELQQYNAASGLVNEAVDQLGCPAEMFLDVRGPAR